MKYIRESKANCKNCYRCLKNCVVKSIKSEGERVSVVDELCILCGLCITSCPQFAKHAQSDILKVMQFAESPKIKTVVSLSSSYVSAFGENYKKVIPALKLLGFDYVEEDSIGAYYVTEEYKKLIEKGKMENIITSSCSAANMLVAKYYPELINMLAPVLSSTLVHGKLLKNKYGKDIKVIFAGPCLAKMKEADENSEYIDGVLSFSQIARWLQGRGISFDELDEEYFDKTEFSSIYPISDGIIIDIKRKMGISEFTWKIKNYDVLSVSGVKELKQMLNDIRDGKIKNTFIEANVCRGGCINGPLMPYDKKTSASDRIKIFKYAESGILEHDKIDIDFSRNFVPEAIENNMPSEQEIINVLRQIDKDKPEKQLNCGSCGYPTCREKAIAVCQKKAELYMCLPYMSDINQTMANVTLSVTPNYIIAVDENMIIKEFNVAAQKLFHISRSDAITKNISEFIDPIDFKSVIKTKTSIYDKKVKYDKLGIITKQDIIYNNEINMVIAIMYDITDEERKKEKTYEMKLETVDMAQNVISKQMTVAQQIASLLGETTAETKVTLNKLKKLIIDEGTENDNDNK